MTIKYEVIGKDKPPFWPENWEFPMKEEVAAAANLPEAIVVETVETE